MSGRIRRWLGDLIGLACIVTPFLLLWMGTP